MNIVEKAREIAIKAHQFQYRKDGVTPYITHPASVVAILERDGCSDLIIASAWLHDVLEDTDVKIESLIDCGIPEIVVAAVDLLTRKNEMSYFDYIMSIYSCESLAGQIARLVKIADLKHNISCFDVKKGSLFDKYQLALFILTNNTKKIA